MNVEIFNEDTNDETIYLKLMGEGKNRISLCACNRDGKVLSGGYLIYIRIDDEKIKFTRCNYVSSRLPMDLDEKQRIIIT